MTAWTIDKFGRILCHRKVSGDGVKIKTEVVIDPYARERDIYQCSSCGWQLENPKDWESPTRCYCPDWSWCGGVMKLVT